MKVPPALFLPTDRFAMIRLKALKPLRYATRRLLPGDEFEAKPRDVRVLLATRKVSQVREPAAVPAPPPAVAEKIAAAVAPSAPPAPPTVGVMTSSDADLTSLRAEYEKVVGRRPFMGWDAGTLREKMAAADAAS